jgi:hypothetical protein
MAVVGFGYLSDPTFLVCIDSPGHWEVKRPQAETHDLFSLWLSGEFWKHTYDQTPSQNHWNISTFKKKNAARQCWWSATKADSNDIEKSREHNEKKYEKPTEKQKERLKLSQKARSEPKVG